MDENDAYVQVLALASSSNEFYEAIEQAFASLGFTIVEVEDVEPLATRRRQWTVDESLLVKAAGVEETGHPRFGTFMTWQSDD